ncbi:MAG: helix-turn-helix domain-containing protein [Lentisphaeria bacterium]|nr:helix-turn-helix domain-containing protein [Lentisphaeria bacterium]
MKSKTFHSAGEFIAKLCDEPQLADKVSQEVQKKELMSRLACVRVKKGLSQRKVAEIMQTSVSSISRLEDMRDADVKLGELYAYAHAMNLDVSLAVEDMELPVALRIKHCVGHVEALLQQLTELAKTCGDDKAIVDHIIRFRGEVLYNFLLKYLSTGENLSEDISVLPQTADKKLDRKNTEISITN